MPSPQAGESSDIWTTCRNAGIENDLERYAKAYSRMDATTSAGGLSSARMITRGGGRTPRILRRIATSSWPVVCLPVITRSKGVDLTSAKASSAPEAFCIRQPSGLRRPARADSTSGSSPIKSATGERASVAAEIVGIREFTLPVFQRQTVRYGHYRIRHGPLHINVRRRGLSTICPRDTTATA